jgi:adenylate kinase
MPATTVVTERWAVKLTIEDKVIASSSASPWSEALPVMSRRGAGPMTMPRVVGGAPRSTIDTGPPLVVVLGAPGSGKGTQCERLGDALGLAHVSTGDALRREVHSGSALGQRAERSLRSGHLVPDELVLETVTKALAQCRGARGVLLDGFPRTETQARSLELLGFGSVQVAAVLVVPRIALLERLRDRRRADDRLDIVRRRLIAYEVETRPLLELYGRHGVLVHVDGNRSRDEVTDTLRTHLLAAGIGTSRTSV